MDCISPQVSQKFRFVSILSMFAVVFIHAKIITSRWECYMDTSTPMGRVSDLVQFSISELICRLAVPLFFLISGFFMAYHNDGSLGQYLVKVRRRIRSLLLPYILFSTLWLVISILIKKVELDNVLNFFYYVFISPVPFQFWFLQHLMILVLGSLLLYHFIKRLGIVAVVMLGLIYLLDNDMHGGFAGSLFYYGLGMSFCIKSFHIKYGKACLLPFLILFAVLCCWRSLFVINPGGYGVYCVTNKVFVFCGVCAVMWWILENKNPFSIPKWLSIGAGTSFFVFCAHEPLLSFLKSKFLQEFSTQQEIFIGYFVLPTTTILLCLIADFLIKKTRLYGLLTGGR